jgi:hypothetical protein
VSEVCGAVRSVAVVRPRRTYVVSLYDAEESVVVEAVHRDERARVDDLDALPERIRQWEDDEDDEPPTRVSES